MTHTPTTTTATTPRTRPPTRGRTRALLGCGVVAGPLFIVVTTAQVLSRDGFDIWRHPISLLGTGPLGWVQSVTFAVTGALYVACAAGMRRALAGGRGRTFVPWLIGLFGAALVWAGVFAADPADGFPAGTPAGHPAATIEGTLHNLAPGIAFPALIVAFVVLARRFAADGRRGWAAGSVAVAALLLTPDLFLAHHAFTLVLALAGAIGWLWMSAVSARMLADAR